MIATCLRIFYYSLVDLFVFDKHDVFDDGDIDDYYRDGNAALDDDDENADDDCYGVGCSVDAVCD